MDEHETVAKYDLAETCALSISLQELLRLASERDGEGPFEQSPVFTSKLGYGHIHGSPKLRQRIADTYASSSGITKENIIVTQGAIGANFLSIMGLVQRDDHVVVVSPSYQQLTELPRSFGANVSTWQLDPKQEWKHDLDTLRSLLTPKTKMLIINNPNNPTGSIVTTEALTQIHRLVKELAAPEALILCDEVYAPNWHSVPADQVPASLLDLGFDNVLVTGSLSKAYSLAGLRVGWIASARRDILDKLLGIRDYNVISVSGLDDEMAARALGKETRKAIIARNIKLAQTNRKIVADWIEQHRPSLGVDWVPSNAGNVAMLYLGDGIDDVKFCSQLCDEYSVNVVPAGLCFGHPSYVRVGYVGNTEQLVKGLELMAELLQKWPRQ